MMMRRLVKSPCSIAHAQNHRGVSMQTQDVVNVILSGASLVVAIASLIVAIVAFGVSRRVAAITISTPLVLQHLYDLVEYLHGRKRITDLQQDVQRLFDELRKVRQKSFILRQAGFGSRLDDLEVRAKAFGTLRDELAARQGSVTEAEGKELTQRALRIDEAVQALLQEIEPKLDGVFKDPFITPKS
jgi:hypothetical protein